MSEAAPIDYAGPPELAPAVLAALRDVVDPEMAVNIVDLGLVYGVAIEGHEARVRLTMTSAACPVAELIVDEVADALGPLLGEGAQVDVELCWEPPWTPERMSARARAVLGDA